MKRRKAASANLLIVGIFTLLAVGSWVIFDVYRALTNTTIPEVLQKVIEPLKANLTTSIVNDLKARRQFDPVALSRVLPYLKTTTSSASAEEQISILPGTEAPFVEEASESGEIQTPTASPSGETTSTEATGSGTRN